MFVRVILILFLWQSVICFQGETSNMQYKFYGVSLNATVSLESIVEDHKVTTNDGYILTLKRIKNDGPPVLIIHGLFGSFQDFMVFGNDKSLPYSLSEQGYDIWLGNNRGNSFSRSHNSLDVNAAKFWNFSFHEMGYYDCPAFIDYILSETNSTSLTLIGHAQGASQILVMAATRPEYSMKVNQIIAFAPFVYMYHIPHPVIQLIKSQYSLVEVLLSKYHIDEFLGHNSKIANLLKIACRLPSISKYCSLVPYLLGGMNPEALELEILLQLFDVFPAGTSSKNMKHLLQQVNSGEFKQFDYGLMGNMNQYKQLKPPIYNLSDITIPVNIFYSKNDWLAGEADIEKLEMELPNCKKRVVPLKYFNHYDYVLAKDVKSLLHYDVINLVNDNHNKSEITTTSTTTDTPATKQQPSAPTTITSTHRSTPTSTQSSTLTPSVTTKKTNSGFVLGYSLIVHVLCAVCLIIK